MCVLCIDVISDLLGQLGFRGWEMRYAIRDPWAHNVTPAASLRSELWKKEARNALSLYLGACSGFEARLIMIDGPRSASVTPWA